MTDNELIAEFMGGDPTEHAWWNKDNLQYHSSWDWTITSVVKIFKLYNESDHDRYWCKYSFKIRKALANADHPEVYKAVVEFIKWYNQNK